eukprot:15439399-Alexandrium_andersonii.AAC.1
MTDAPDGCRRARMRHLPRLSPGPPNDCAPPPPRHIPGSSPPFRPAAMHCLSHSNTEGHRVFLL